MKKKNTQYWLLFLLLFVLTSCAGKKYSQSSLQKSVSKPDALELVRLDLSKELDEKFSGDLKKAQKYYAQEYSKDKNNESVLLKQAILYIQSQKVDQAEKKLKEAQKVNPDNASVKKFLASLYLSKGDSVKAKELYRSLLANKETATVEDAMSLSHVLMLEKNYNEALKVLEDAEKRFSEKHVIYFYKGRAYSEQQDFDQARTYFHRAKKYNSKYIPNIKALGYLEEYQGNFDQAYKHYERALKVDANDSLMRLHLAELYLTKKKYKEAKKHFLKLYEEDKKNATYISKLSIAHYYLDEYDESKFYLNELLKNHPQYEVAYYYLGLLQEKTREYDKAIESLSKVTAKNEYYVDANLVLAQILFDQGKKEEAEKHLQTINKKVYSDRFVRALGRFYLSEGKLKQAEKVLKRYYKKEKDNVQYLFSYAQVLEELKKFEQMERILFSVIEKNPDHARALNYLGYSMLERDKNIEDAFVYVQRAHSISPDNPYIMDSLGWAYYKKEDYSQALKYLKMAHKYRADESIIKEHIADTYVKMNQKSKAKLWYKKILKINSNEDDQKRIKDKLAKL